MLGEQIKQLRLNKKLSQVELSQKLSITKQSVSNWENENIMPSIDMLIKISQIFDVTTDYLLGLSEKHTLDTTGLTEIQISHIQSIINDLREINYYSK